MISCLALSGAAGSPKLLYEPSLDDDVSQTQEAQEDLGDSCSPNRPGNVQDLPIRAQSDSPQHQGPVHENDASTDNKSTLGSPWLDVSTTPRPSLSSESDGERASSWASDFDL